jgi:hypothetical protein
MSRRDDERKPPFACVDCISFDPDGASGLCTVAEHVALPPWAVRPRQDRTVQWNDSCDLFESDQVEVKP